MVNSEWQNQEDEARSGFGLGGLGGRGWQEGAKWDGKWDKAWAESISVRFG